jgi:hypothetical protein
VKFWLIVLLGMGISWLLTDMGSDSGLNNLFFPFLGTLFFFAGLTRLAFRIGPTYIAPGGSGSDIGCGGGDSGGDC